MIATITRAEFDGGRREAWRHAPEQVDLMAGPMFRDATQTEPVGPEDTERPTDVMVVCSLALTADDLDLADTVREVPRRLLTDAIRAARRDDGEGGERTDRAALRAALRGTPEIRSGMAKRRAARERRG
ncbi:MAG: hypothetical protein GY708_20665 [Actinomycetia bacterium]|nr:hypothetical protein [Actinomycetes bacterium]